MNEKIEQKLREKIRTTIKEKLTSEAISGLGFGQKSVLDRQSYRGYR